jgi:hypothetical protein
MNSLFKTRKPQCRTQASAVYGVNTVDKNCQTNPYGKISLALNDGDSPQRNGVRVKVNNKSKVNLPIGRTAQIAFEIESLRAECCAAAHLLTQESPLNEAELEECACIDDALAQAQRLLKCTVSSVMISRLRRRSRIG